MQYSSAEQFATMQYNTAQYRKQKNATGMKCENFPSLRKPLRGWVWGWTPGSVPGDLEWVSVQGAGKFVGNALRQANLQG